MIPLAFVQQTANRSQYLHQADLPSLAEMTFCFWFKNAAASNSSNSNISNSNISNNNISNSNISDSNISDSNISDSNISNSNISNSNISNISNYNISNNSGSDSSSDGSGIDSTHSWILSLIHPDRNTCGSDSCVNGKCYDVQYVVTRHVLEGVGRQHVDCQVC